MKSRKVLILTTGGTIDGVEKSGNGEKYNQDSMISHFLDTANLGLDYTIKSLFKKDSRDINADDLAIISKNIGSSEYSKILITHGTYTMTDTAKYLGKIGFNKTIVLVGSFVLGHIENTDAPFNLGFALGAIQMLPRDVYICMNGKCIIWKKVQKNLVKKQFESS